jgi:hypothetical protein
MSHKISLRRRRWQVKAVAAAFAQGLAQAESAVFGAGLRQRNLATQCVADTSIWSIIRVVPNFCE